MKVSDIRKYSYTCMLFASLFLAAGAWKLGWLTEGENGLELSLPGQAGQVKEVMQPLRKELVFAEEQEASVLEEETEEGPVMYTAETSYFDDALFIGDSRTVGLYEYGDLGNAEVIAGRGMNVYKIYDREFETVSGEKKKLEAVLQERTFGKIYLMLGINELGYSCEKTAVRYEELVEYLQTMQPDAILFLQANLHMTAEKSESSPVYTNENLDRFNEAVRGLTDGRTRFYLDINELFDDEEGNLSKEYSADNAHVYGKYYADWVNWLLEHAVRTEEKKEKNEPGNL